MMRPELGLAFCLLAAGCSEDFDPLDPGGLSPGVDVGVRDSGPRDTSLSDRGDEPPDASTEPDARQPDAEPSPDAEPKPDANSVPCRGNQAFCDLRDGMVGRWSGRAITANGDVYGVLIEFRADGTYLASCLADTGCDVPFYYGSPGRANGQTYELFDLTAGGTGTANIAIVFNGNQRPNLGELQQIDLSNDSLQLSFRFRPTWLETRFFVNYELNRLLP